MNFGEMNIVNIDIWNTYLMETYGLELKTSCQT